MGEYFYSHQFKAFVKECPKCKTTYTGHEIQHHAEQALSKYFAQDRHTKDGFYGRCRICVSKDQRNKRDGRLCDSDALLEAQDGRCGICEKPLSYSIELSKVTAYIDHDHNTNKIRGILCVRCNSLLHMVENPDLLSKALAYLRRANENNQD